MTEAPYGTWHSPISAREVSRGGVRLGGVALSADGSLWWAEGRPSEGGRTVVCRRDTGGRSADVLPPPWNARTRVHEYGGGAWLALGDGVLVFANWDDQRLYRLDTSGGAGEDPRPLTPEPDEPLADRYADLVLSSDGSEVICVREHALGPGTAVVRDLVAVSLDDSMRVRSLTADGHFLSNPRPSPDGAHLAWLRWDHPRMPWDGTELRVARVMPDGTIGEPRTLIGGDSESVFQPEWSGERSLFAVSDRTGWWNLYETGLDDSPRPLCPKEEEFGHPQWVFGMSRYGILADGRLAVTHGRGTWNLSILDPSSGELDAVVGGDRGDITYFEPSLSARGSTVATVAGGARTPLSVLTIDVASRRTEVVRRSIDVLPDDGYLPPLRQVTFEGAGGRDVHGFVYPPTNPGFNAPASERPPFVVFVHGGPTAQVTAALDMQAAYFTSRGIGVVAVDYGGSTGYGRQYRNRLNGEWGVVDVEDVVAAATRLAERGEADPARLLVRGGSAGGWTVLAALTRTATFAAGTSYFGVAELLSMVEDTHDFESRYVDGLVGPLPEAKELYVERSPLSHVDELERPILLLQGDQDKIVPPNQAEMFADAMRQKGIPHAYLLFEGEQHGFRRAENIERALEAELSFYAQILGFEAPGVPVLPIVR